LQTTNPPQSPFDKGEAATPSLVKGRVGEGFVVFAIFKSLLIEDRLFKFGIKNCPNKGQFFKIKQNSKYEHSKNVSSLSAIQPPTLEFQSAPL
ncbi:MAG: hypothetical protein Greene101420_530, partial [Parcubacteria group bacterium Greene1014_20]